MLLLRIYPKKQMHLTVLFAKQCSLLELNSVLPAPYDITHHRLDSADLDPSKILTLIRSLEVNKVNGWDDVSMRMVKISE